MFRFIVSFVGGVYVGQEYKGLPQVKRLSKEILIEIEKELEKYREK